MAIDRNEAMEALEELNVSDADKAKLKELIEANKTFEDFCVETLGQDAADEYLAEEATEHYILNGSPMAYDEITLAEYLAGIEDEEPWHKGESIDRLFQEEAAEPWHDSLKEAVNVQAGSVLEYFEANKQYEETADRIRRMITEGGEEYKPPTWDETEDEDDPVD
jgi:hypothetical protein